MPEISEIRPLSVVIMAAGQGKRMQDPTRAKVLYPLADRPLVGHVLELCRKLAAENTICIIGYGREQVSEYLGKDFPAVQVAIQEEQLGTGHAVQQTERLLNDFNGDVLILSGDVPLLTEATVQNLIEVHRSTKAVATVLAVTMENPAGYGRIIRSATGSLEKIVEEKDALPSEKQVKEINTGIYVFDSATLFEVLKHIDRRNAQGEYYLTDAFGLIIRQFGVGSASIATTNDPVEVSGINTKDQLDALEKEYFARNS